MFDFPSSPANGQTFIPTVGGPAYVWDGIAWKLSSGGLSGAVYIGDTPPANPVSGQLWWESDSGNTFIYYQDANSGQWVQFNVADDAETDHISSVVADMRLGFKSTTANHLAINNKADGSGSDVITMTDTGGISASAFATTSSLLSGQILSSLTSLSAYVGIFGGKSDAAANYGANLILWGPTAAGASVMEFRQLGTTRGSILSNGSWLFNTSIQGEGSGYFKWGLHAHDVNGTINIYGSFPSAFGVTFTGPGTDYGIVSRNIVAGTAGHVQFIYYTTAVGAITCTSTATAYGTTSDIRTKGIVEEPQDARLLVDAIQVVEFVPIQPRSMMIEGDALFADSFAVVEGVEPPANPTMMGIPAQQAYSVYPAAVTPPDINMPDYNPDAQFGDEDFKPWMVDYSKFVPMILANTQQNNSRLDSLEARIAALEAA